MIPLLADAAPQSPYFQWVMIALAVGTIFYVAVIRPAMQKKKDPLVHSPIAGLSKERHVERQMQNLLVELSEMTRQISAQLDTRSQKLQLLIQDADERIAQLQQMEKQGMRSPPMVESVWSAPAAPSRPPPPAEPVDEEHQKVYALADRGQNAGDIAKELNRPRGEVELILALRPKAPV
jgi:small-conductance mechanosensitive channel